MWPLPYVKMSVVFHPKLVQYHGHDATHLLFSGGWCIMFKKTVIHFEKDFH